MDANLSSRKRKEIPPTPFSTSKSQNLHHNESGGVITRSNRTQFVDESPRAKSRRSNRLQKNILAHVCVKDLRSRRVFSPTSSLIEDEDCCKDGGTSKLDYQLQMPNVDNPNLGSYESRFDKNDGLERSELQDPSNGSVELNVDLNRQVSFVEGSCDGNLNDNVGAVNLSEESAQVTPQAVGEFGGNGGISNASVCRNLIDSSNVSIARSKRQEQRLSLLVLHQRFAVYDRHSALHVIVANGRIEIVAMLLDRSVSPDLLNRHKQGICSICEY